VATAHEREQRSSGQAIAPSNAIRTSELPKARVVVASCSAGPRSFYAAKGLHQPLSDSTALSPSLSDDLGDGISYASCSTVDAPFGDKL